MQTSTKFYGVRTGDEHGQDWIGLDQDWRQFWPDQDGIGLQFFWKLADQDRIGLRKFLLF